MILISLLCVIPRVPTVNVTDKSLIRSYVS